LKAIRELLNDIGASTSRAFSGSSGTISEAQDLERMVRNSSSNWGNINTRAPVYSRKIGNDLYEVAVTDGTMGPNGRHPQSWKTAEGQTRTNIVRRFSSSRVGQFLGSLGRALNKISLFTTLLISESDLNYYLHTGQWPSEISAQIGACP